jgi:hypothetical protein
MAKQTGYVKATGTVDGDTNFYYDEEWGFLVRMRSAIIICSYFRRSNNCFELESIIECRLLL